MLSRRLRGYFALRMPKDFNFRRLMETAPAMRWLSPKPTDRILDIGCGNGVYDYRIARKAGRVVGFDMLRGELLKAVSQKLEKRFKDEQEILMIRQAPISKA